MANPTLLKTPIASGGDKNTIPETTGSTTGLLSQEKGWQQINSLPINAGGIAPSRLDFNGVFNLLSNILFYTQKGWQWEFDETQDYFAGCTVKDTADGKTYVCIADVSASTTHPSSDTTHWQLSDLATKDDLSNYLPLSGGALTGQKIVRNANDDALIFFGGKGEGATGYGADIQLYGPTHPTLAGVFRIFAENQSATKMLEGKTDGSLTWDGANILTDASGGYLPLAGGNMTGTIVARSVDNDVLIFFGGKGEPSTGYGSNLQLYGPTHSTLAGRFRIYAEKFGVNKLLEGQTDGTLTWANNDLGGSAIVAKSIGTTGYYKRADGLIEQWGQTTAPATVSDNVPVTFPITFPNAVSSVVITSEGNLTEGNSPMSYTQVIDVTASGFKYRSFFNSPGEIKKYWRAIGY